MYEGLCVCVCTGAAAWYVVLGGVYVCVCCLDMCCLVLLHSVFVCKHVGAALAKGTGGCVHFILAFLRRSDEVV